MKLFFFRADPAKDSSPYGSGGGGVVAAVNAEQARDLIDAAGYGQYGAWNEELGYIADHMDVIELPAQPGVLFYSGVSE